MDGPLMKEFMPFSGIQYKTIISNNFEIKINYESNSFVKLINGSIIKVLNICQINNESSILGFNFRSRLPFYTKPIDSTKLGIYLVDNMSNNLCNWQVNTIQSKCMILKINIKNSCIRSNSYNQNVKKLIISLFLYIIFYLQLQNFNYIGVILFLFLFLINIKILYFQYDKYKL